jgi:hypothetical protein
MTWREAKRCLQTALLGDVTSVLGATGPQLDCGRAAVLGLLRRLSARPGNVRIIYHAAKAPCIRSRQNKLYPVFGWSTPFAAPERDGVAEPVPLVYVGRYQGTLGRARGPYHILELCAQPRRPRCALSGRPARGACQQHPIPSSSWGDTGSFAPIGNSTEMRCSHERAVCFVGSVAKWKLRQLVLSSFPCFA